MGIARRWIRSGRGRAVIASTILGGAIGLTQVAGASPGTLDPSAWGPTGDATCSLPSRPVTCGSSASVVATAGGHVAGVEGAAPTARPVGSGDATAVTGQEPAPPDVQVTKTSDANGTLREGDPIRYTITVTNVGGTTAEDVEVHDELPAGMGGIDPGASFGGEPCLVLSSVVIGGIPQATVECGPLGLEAGASASLEIEASTEDLCGGFVNRVDVRASNEPAELAGIGNHAEARDAVETCHPDIALEVTASPEEGPVGASIALTYLVRNTGDTRLYGITVRDDALGPLGQVDVFALSPGATERFTATTTLGTSPLTTSASAVGMDVTGLRVGARDAVSVSVVSAGGGDGGGDEGETPAGTPFTGARTDAGSLAAVLSLVGAALVALTGRRRRPV